MPYDSALCCGEVIRHLAIFWRMSHITNGIFRWPEARLPRTNEGKHIVTVEM